MLNTENLLTNNITECLESISKLEAEIKILRMKAACFETEVVTDDEIPIEDEVPSQCESIFDDKVVSDFWWDWQTKYDHKNFAGFVNYNMPCRLGVGKRYGLSIGPVALIGERLQLLAMLFDEEDWEGDILDSPIGLILEEYKVGTEEFKKMAIAVFAPFHKSVISVEVDRICDAVGTICLKEVDGKLCLDWKTFNPDQTPQSEAFKATWKIADRIKSTD